jgi:hypothetical protein
MTPKEKAKEIILNYESIIALNSWCDENTTEKEINRLVKKTALIAVDEIDAIYQKLTPKDDPYYFLLELEYWQEIKTEIEKL